MRAASRWPLFEGVDAGRQLTLGRLEVFEGGGRAVANLFGGLSLGVLDALPDSSVGSRPWKARTRTTRARKRAAKRAITRSTCRSTGEPRAIPGSRVGVPPTSVPASDRTKRTHTRRPTHGPGKSRLEGGSPCMAAYGRPLVGASL